MRTQILTPMQNARCIVRAYPFVPDSAALAACLAARCGCQGAKERLSIKRQMRIASRPSPDGAGASAVTAEHLSGSADLHSSCM